MINHKKIVYFAKYFFFLAIIIRLFSSGFTSKRMILCGFCELGTIGLVTELIRFRFKKLAYIFNSISLFLGNLQNSILYFGSSYASLQMLNNLESVSDMSGSFLKYGIAIVLIIVFSFLPITDLKFHRTTIIYLACIQILFILVCVITKSAQLRSPYYATYLLIKDSINYTRLKRDVSVDKNTIIHYRWGQSSVEAQKISNQLTGKNNIILIFTEGLSEHIINDDRNIMPNARALERKSIRFENYYNHTFATYMGLNGQLYSGYQRDNLDANHLPSLQSILHNNNYYTVFFNTEPKNITFTKYLYRMEFDEVITDESELKGCGNSVSDANAYENILETAESLHHAGKLFFIVCYTFGTHASFDSVDDKFGDGSDKLLNKFYNVDVQLGKFLMAFENSNLFNDTLFIFTTDHCTFEDSDFRNSFPDYERECQICDKIPLYLYTKAIDGYTYNAEGRNSLCLAPTILDILNISEKNFFLGNSLFNQSSKYDKLFCSIFTYRKTDISGIHKLNKSEERDFSKDLQTYYSLTLLNIND